MSMLSQPDVPSPHPKGERLTLIATRAGLPEMTHHLEWVQCSASGQVMAGTASAIDPNTPYATWMRSCAKPFQLLACVPPDQLALHPPQALAVAAGSHSGEAAHLPWVHYWLDQCPPNPSSNNEPPCLQCGQHPAITAYSHTPASALTHNCSGNHGVMLWATTQPGFPSSPFAYTHRDHPLQQRVLSTLAHWLGQPILSDQVGIDGCGVPTVYMPLQAMAGAYARLVSTPEVAPLVAAMTGYPHLVAGHDRLDTALMQASQSTGPLLSKVGADGLVCVAHLGLKQAVALKACDGNQPARDRAIVGLLTQLGWLELNQCQAHPMLANLLNPHRTNGLGKVIGQWVLSSNSR